MGEELENTGNPELDGSETENANDDADIKALVSETLDDGSLKPKRDSEVKNILTSDPELETKTDNNTASLRAFELRIPILNPLEDRDQLTNLHNTFDQLVGKGIDLLATKFPGLDKGIAGRIAQAAIAYQIYVFSSYFSHELGHLNAILTSTNFSGKQIKNFNFLQGFGFDNLRGSMCGGLPLLPEVYDMFTIDSTHSHFYRNDEIKELKLGETESIIGGPNQNFLKIPLNLLPQ